MFDIDRLMSQLSETILMDDLCASCRNFELTMLALKNSLKNENGCDVTFRTVEEKSRLIREKAMKSTRKRSTSAGGQSLNQRHLNGMDHGRDDASHFPLSPNGDHGAPFPRGLNRYASLSSLPSPEPSPLRTPKLTRQHSLTSNSSASRGRSLSNAPRYSLTEETIDGTTNRKNSLENLFAPVDPEEPEVSDMIVRVDIKNRDACTVIVVRPVNPASESEYRVDNGSVSHIIYYKQKGVPGTWNALGPGI